VCGYKDTYVCGVRASPEKGDQVCKRAYFRARLHTWSHEAMQSMHTLMRFQAHACTHALSSTCMNALHIWYISMNMYHIHSMCIFVHVCLYTLGICLCVYGQFEDTFPQRAWKFWQMCTYAYTCRRWGGGSCRMICWRDLVI
jgi:hypothetical protein